MLKTYAQYNYTNDSTARMIGLGWHEITREYTQYRPSGKHTIIVINGVAVKAKYCTVVQVFTTSK